MMVNTMLGDPVSEWLNSTVQVIAVVMQQYMAKFFLSVHSWWWISKLLCIAIKNMVLTECHWNHFKQSWSYVPSPLPLWNWGYSRNSVQWQRGLCLTSRPRCRSLIYYLQREGKTDYNPHTAAANHKLSWLNYTYNSPTVNWRLQSTN